MGYATSESSGFYLHFANVSLVWSLWNAIKALEGVCTALAMCFGWYKLSSRFGML